MKKCEMFDARLIAFVLFVKKWLSEELSVFSMSITVGRL